MSSKHLITLFWCSILSAFLLELVFSFNLFYLMDSGLDTVYKLKLISNIVKTLAVLAYMVLFLRFYDGKVEGDTE